MNDQRVALITGASGNLGSAIARSCAQHGHAVAIHYRSGRDRAEGVAEEVRRGGGNAITVQADLADDPAGASCIVTEVLEHFGRLDALVNNSADQSTGSLVELTDDDWQHMLNVNLAAVTRLTRAATDVMEPGAAIVNISSVEASSAFPNHAHYAASKAALESFTRSLALELAPRGIRSNAVAPGLIEREALPDDWPQGHRWWSGAAPIGRPVTAPEVAEAVAFLLSDQASGISGVVLPVDGGWSASARAPF